jgi:APA family basic amino acid/polyamine antiporter
VGAIAVSVGWSGYMVSFLRDFGIQIPPELSAARGIHLIELPAALAAVLKMKVGWTVFGGELGNQIKAAGTDPASLHQVTAIFNLPAVIIVAIVTVLLVIGIRESAGFNNLIVFLKIAVVLLFIVGAAKAINPANWHPFIPVNTGRWGDFGWSGVMRGASLVFFAYIGFDAVSTAAQEAKNPRRDVPIGIIGSLLVCTVLYILVSGIATGVVPYRLLDVPEPIALAADHANMGWMARIIKLGAIAGLSSVILVMMLGQTRVFWSMSRDGLLPPLISRVHPRFKTPWLITIATGVVVALFGAVLPVRDAGNLCNIGTLLAFVIVSVGVLVLRVREPELQRKFKVPAIWFVAPMGALSAFALMLYLPLMTWMRLLVWFLIGMVIYFTYGRRHSKLQSPTTPATPD